MYGVCIQHFCTVSHPPFFYRSGGSQPGSNSSTPVNTPEKNPPTDERCYHGSKNRDKVRARFEAVMGSGESSEQRQSRSECMVFAVCVLWYVRILSVLTKLLSYFLSRQLDRRQKIQQT